MSNMIMRCVLVRGRVQGVGYRAWTQRTAMRHGLDGWVRNRADGSVEALFIGAIDVVELMIEACRSGPRSASVHSLDIREALPSDLAMRNDEEGFVVLPTE
jgi:acylphosphatase